MSPVEKQKLLDDTLAWVNEVRSKYGLSQLGALRRGTRREACDCPIAKSLLGGPFKQLTVGRSDFYAWDGATLVADGLFPIAVQEFIAAFDGGEIPELDMTVAA